MHNLSGTTDIDETFSSSSAEHDAVAELDAAQERIAQLERALQTRIVIEQAKGVLAERLGIPIDDAFQLLRYAARSSHANLHDLAAEVVAAPESPRAITIALARSMRWRSALMREHAEHQRERALHLHAEVRAQQERLAWEHAEHDPASPRRDPPHGGPGRISVRVRSAQAANALVERLRHGTEVDTAELPSGERVISWDYAAMPEWHGESHDSLRQALALLQAWVDERGASQIMIGERQFTMSPRRP